MGELYVGCLLEELRTTDGDAVDAADIGTGEGVMLGGNFDMRTSGSLETWALLR